MNWWAIDVHASADRRDAVGAWLVERTGQAVEELDDGTIVTVAEDEAQADRLIAELRALPGAPAATRRPIEAVDWHTRWREGIQVRRFGRLTVAPSWRATDAPEPAVIIDPEMAFGTGEHGSTRAALILLERHLRPGDRVLDLGSGSGILSIAAVKLGAARAVGVEVDVEANVVAENNARRNHVEAQVTFLHGDAADLAPLLRPVELLLSNILRVVNVALLPEIGDALAPGGIAVFSGMESAEAPLFRSDLAAGGFEVVDDVIDAGWWAVAARHG